MSEKSTTRPDAKERHHIEYKLRSAWHKERRFHHLRGLCFLAIWAVLLVLLDLLIDWLFLASYNAPGWARVALMALNAVTLLVVLYRYWWRHLRYYDGVRVALEFERKHPELKSLLVSYLQIDDRAGQVTHASPALVAAMRREAVTVTRPMDFKEVISYRLLGRLGAFSFCVLAFFGAVSFYKSEFFRTLLRRMMNPVVELEYPTRTRVKVLTGDVNVQQGTTLTVAAVCEGELPPKGTLHVKADDGDWESLSFLRTRGNLYSYRFSEVRQSFHYYVEIGDDESDPNRVEVIPAPKVVEKKVTLVYPPHTKLPEETRDSYYVEAPEGTKITWRLRCDRPVSAATMVRNGQDANDLEITEGGYVVTGTVQAWESFDYRFRWQLAGLGFIYDSPGAYTVHITPDTPPMVEIVEPWEDERATVRKRLTVTYRASDDYGLAEARLVYSVDDGPEKTWTIGPLSGKTAEPSFEKRLIELIPNLAVDQTVTYHLEVADNRGDRRGPNVSASRKRRVYVVSIEEYLRSILEEQLRWIAEVEELRGEERQADQQVESMKSTAATQPATTQPAATQSAPSR
ncbi:MAG TPA: DUF4175 family protein [Phycisphaerae bacterium]|nr:DUF4175 family protein [Phycisphaerae bacterium]